MYTPVTMYKHMIYQFWCLIVHYKIFVDYKALWGISKKIGLFYFIYLPNTIKSKGNDSIWKSAEQSASLRILVIINNSITVTSFMFERKHDRNSAKLIAPATLYEWNYEIERQP